MKAEASEKGGRKRKRVEDTDNDNNQSPTCLQLSLRPSRLSNKIASKTALEKLDPKDLKVGAEVRHCEGRIQLARLE